MISIDLNKSIEELENDYWGQAKFESSLVEKCHSLRRVPLKELNIEAYRILIGQNIGLKYLIPLAVEVLKRNPLSEGDLYEGDLLSSVLTVENAFWKENKNYIEDIKQIIESARRQMLETNLQLIPEILASIDNATKIFLKNIE